MDARERRALENLRIDWAPTYDDVWQPVEGHVAELNRPVFEAVMAAFGDAAASDGRSPLGVAVIGQHGVGKTHMITRARDEVLHRGGYFFLVSLLHGHKFWPNIRHALLSGLNQYGANNVSQLRELLRRFATQLKLPDPTARQITGATALTRPALDDAVGALTDAAPEWGTECRHTARALVLLGARNTDARDIAEAYLTSESDDMRQERAEWGIHGRVKPAQEVVREMSRLIAFTGPSMLAVDQIDTLIAQSGRSTDLAVAGRFDAPHELVAGIAVGLMDLREYTRRTVTVVACQAQAWEQISNSQPSAGQRFRRESRLRPVDSAEIGRAVVAARFAPRFAQVGFRPPYPTWPVLAEAFDESVDRTPRQMFMRIDEHIRVCLDTNTVLPLAGFAGTTTAPPVPRQDSDLTRLDAEFTELTGRADASAALTKSAEDARMPWLLIAGLRSYVKEIGDEDSYTVDRPQGNNPAVHARLRKILDQQTDDQIHWVFRAVAGPSPRTAQNRIRRLHEDAGLDPRVPKRKAFLLRTGPWSRTTPRTSELLAGFEDAGGVIVDQVDVQDLNVFDALERMLRSPDPALDTWLRERRPAGRTALFRQVFGDPETTTHDPMPEPGPAPDTASDAWPTDDLDVRQAPVDRAADVGLGWQTEVDVEVRVRLEALRKHTAVFAGSGSGKTVLIRRLVEECALCGVSAIVLDPNNDLARLGDAWPHPPRSWRPGDAEKARDYLANTEVLVWTPRLAAGRPLSLQPLPDLVSLVDDPDEFGLALDTAVAALAPRARTDGTTAKAEQGRAVLREALSAFARDGGTGLGTFLTFLADLPTGVATLSRAWSMAQEMSETLRAAMINDPLFGGAGTPLDPGVLLTPERGKRARISVVSMIGLPTDPQRQGFVNQLQMALFAWIKRHPAGDRPLGGLFVMDEAQTLAPSDGKTACTASTLALASQARKYGLGLVFATQAPKAIHNRIVGNAATQLFGFINSPVQVAAAKEMAAAKASTVLHISRLRAGEFYLGDEGSEFRKVRTPMCLSHHPTSALTAEEVLVRARSGT
ncbi:MAG TPA: DUF87 domain-containing protein [Pseudonocardiaceae bacterium]|nr:DUF87 domain-containing protein [Pseudonocardiaceae bacterium]